MSEPEFVLSEDEKSQAAAHIVERGARMLRDGLSLDAASDAVQELGEEWLTNWRFKQTLLGMNHSLGAVAVRAFDSNADAESQNIPSTPPVYGGEEFAPGEVENEAAIATNLTGYLLPVLAQMIDADFSPASTIKGARDSIQSLRSIRRGEGPNEYGILSVAIQIATKAAPYGFRQADLDRAAAMLIEMVRLQLGGKDEAPRDLSAKNFVDLVLRGHDNVFARHAGKPKIPAENGSLAKRTIGPPRYVRLNNARIKNGPRGKRGVVSIREAVLNSMGVKTPAGYHERPVYSNRPA